MGYVHDNIMGSMMHWFKRMEWNEMLCTQLNVKKKNVRVKKMRMI